MIIPQLSSNWTEVWMVLERAISYVLHFTIYFLLPLHLIVITSTKIIHVSNNNISNNNPDCGNLTQPCYSVTYALKMVRKGDNITVAIDSRYKFLVQKTLKIVTNHKLEMNYCTGDIECHGKQKSEIEFSAKIKANIFSFCTNLCISVSIKPLHFILNYLSLRIHFEK